MRYQPVPIIYYHLALFAKKNENMCQIRIKSRTCRQKRILFINTLNSKTLTRKNCPICKSDQIRHILSAKDYTVSKEQFEVWHCEDCEVRFTQNIPIEFEIGKYYQSEEYISHSNTSKGLINTLYQWVRDYTLGQKRKLIKKISGLNAGSLLDIGCGTGEFLKTMKDAGWEVQGLEPDEGAREQAINNLGLKVDEPEHLFALPKAQYDVITMWHVLEHVHRLHEYMDQIKSLLKPDGSLIIAVPNYQSWDAEHYQAEWAAYDVPRHLYHFSASAMEKLLVQHEFELKQIKKMPFDGFYVSLLSEKYKYGKMRLVAGAWSGFRSFLDAKKQASRCSSIMYIVKARLKSE